MSTKLKAGVKSSLYCQCGIASDLVDDASEESEVCIHVQFLITSLHISRIPVCCYRDFCFRNTGNDIQHTSYRISIATWTRSDSQMIEA